MPNKILIIISTLSLFLLGCASSKSSFSHAQHGELPASSPLLEKELRNCSQQIKKESINPIPTVGDVAISSIPVVLTEDVIKGIEQGTEAFQVIRTVKTINNLKNTTQKARNNLLGCMEKRGWTAVEK